MMVAVHIGKAASVAGVSVDTIRFYQKIGLIKSPGRSAGGYRLFDGEDIHDLTFVRHAQELGFSLTDIKVTYAIIALARNIPFLHKLAAEARFVVA
jgi:DNA-binding transcriptional MerR regulator